jgi:hypothetical protein
MHGRNVLTIAHMATVDEPPTDHRIQSLRTGSFSGSDADPDDPALPT